MNYKIAVAGTGYVGLSLAVLLSQHNEVTAVDIVKEKTDKINRFESPIVDEYIDKFFAEAREGKRHLNLKATTDGDENRTILIPAQLNQSLSRFLRQEAMQR